MAKESEDQDITDPAHPDHPDHPEHIFQSEVVVTIEYWDAHGDHESHSHGIVTGDCFASPSAGSVAATRSALHLWGKRHGMLFAARCVDEVSRMRSLLDQVDEPSLPDELIVAQRHLLVAARRFLDSWKAWVPIAREERVDPDAEDED